MRILKQSGADYNHDRGLEPGWQWNMRKIHLSLWFVFVSFLSLLSFWAWMLLFYRDRPSSAGLYPGLAVVLTFAVLFVVFELLAFITGAVAARTGQGKSRSADVAFTFDRCRNTLVGILDYLMSGGGTKCRRRQHVRRSGIPKMSMGIVKLFCDDT